MSYGTIKVDTITFTAGGSDVSVSVSGLVQNPAITGNISSTGTIQGTNLIGTTLVSGATVTGGQGQFTVLTGVTAGFTTVTGATVTGTDANFTKVSGTTVTGDAAQFTTVTGGTAGFTTVTGTTVTGTNANFSSGVFTSQISGATVIATSGIIASGTAAAPSLSIAGDSDTGLFSPTGDQVGIATSGTTKFRINDYGNACISTSGEFNYGTSSNSVWNVSGVGLCIHNPLAISGGGNPAEIRFTNGTTGANSTASGGLITFYENDLYFWNATPNKVLNFGAAADTRFRVTETSGVFGPQMPAVATANPYVLSMGRSYSNAVGNNPKLRVWENTLGSSSEYMGIGVSPGQLDFIVSSTAYDFVFYGASQTEVLRIKSTGGIKFPAAQLASADANTLDDYEEGTWSPTVFGSSTAGTATYNYQNGRYTKIGRMVFLEAYLSYTSGTGTGNLRIGGLPFTSNSAANYSSCSFGYIDTITFTGQLTAYVSTNANDLVLGTATSDSNWAGLPYDPTGNFTFSVAYSV